MRKNPLVWILIGLLVSVTFLYCLRPLADADFFWHIASGKWIVQNLSLPKADPFSYTAPAPVTGREHFVLTAFWLTQTLYYALFALLGWNGIVFLRFVIAGILLFFIFVRGRSSDVTISLGLTLVAAVAVLHLYVFERPQVFSFLFFSILMYFLDSLRFANNKAPAGKVRFLLPAMMLLWSNMHPGVIVGQVIMLLYIIFEGLKFLHPALDPVDQDTYKGLLYTGIAGILASFVNPNTYRPAIELHNITAVMRQYLLEYLPTPSYFATYNEYGILLYWILLSAMLAVSLYKIFKKKPDITELAIFAGIGFFSFTQMRYIAFFVIWSVPVISSFLSKLNRRMLIKTMTLCLSIAVVFYFLAVQHDWTYVKNMKFLKTDQWIPENFPDAGASFIKESGLKGNMFNFYDWGGYLIWRLSPERKVFSDGRQLSEETFLQTLSILYAVEEPNVGRKPFYKALLDEYQVTYIIVPLSYADGELIPLTQKMISDGQWSVVFSSANTLIFVKHTPENEPLINRYGTDKTRFLNNLFFTIDLSIMINPYDFRLYITKGDLLVGQNMLNEARQAYEKALQIVPFNTAVQRRLYMLNNGPGR